MNSKLILEIAKRNKRAAYMRAYRARKKYAQKMKEASQDKDFVNRTNDCQKEFEEASIAGIRPNVINPIYLRDIAPLIFSRTIITYAGKGTHYCTTVDCMADLIASKNPLLDEEVLSIRANRFRVDILVG